MKAETPQINWHWRSEGAEQKEPTPVFSVDFQHHGGDAWRLATAGGDTTVRIWKVQPGNPMTSIDFLAELARHSGSVNVVRFSPDGKTLASADDEGILLWQQTETALKGNLIESSEINQEHWRSVRALRGHHQDIYDLAWSPDSCYLLSGSVDNTVIVWDVTTGKVVNRFKDHKHYVQGVAWSPTGSRIATQSCDRSCRVYDVCKKKKSIHFPCLAANRRVPAPNLEASTEAMKTDQDKTAPPAEAAKPKMQRLYVDEMKTTFFRRLSFSPDGTLLFSPAGMYLDSEGTDQHTMYIFRASDPTQPVLRLNAADSVVVAVRCSPVLYDKRPASADDTEVFSNLPHRMVFAVATAQSVFLYDTQQCVPFAMASNLHYAPIADLAWSADGRILAVSAEDGYCSFVTFEDGEIGQVSATPSPLQPPPESIFPQAETKEAAKDTADATTDGAGDIAPEPMVTAPKVDAAGKKAKRRIVPTVVMAPESTKRKASESSPDGKSSKRRIAPTLISKGSSVASSSSTTPATAEKTKRRITPTLISS